MLLLALGAIAALVVGWQVAAFAVHDTGAFELDGNATNAAAVPGDDWDNVCHEVLGTDCSTSSNTTGSSARSFVAEPNLNSTLFTGGGSKDPNDVSSWKWKDGAGGLPDKDNLLHSFAARYPNTSDGDVLFFGSDRYDNSGDAQQGFWFFQNKITQTGTTSGSFSGVHKLGDLLVISDFSNGGSVSTITVYKWNPAVSGNLELLSTSDNANCANPNPDTACGIVNPASGPGITNGITPSPWSFSDKSGNTGFANGEFFEGGVNLTALGLANECFSSVASETRSSTSTTAVLKDFVLGSFGECGSSVTTQSTPTGSTSIGNGSVSTSDEATVSVEGVSNWSGTVQFSLKGPIGSPLETTQNIGTKNVSNTTPNVQSDAATVTAAGQYCWSAHFHATSPAEGVPDADDDGTNECFTVTPVTPNLATTAGDDVPLGEQITDRANLTNTANKPGTPAINPTSAGGPAGGTITFKAYGPDDCETVAFTSAPVSVSGNGEYGPVSFTPTEPGTYHWVATYSGDSPNTNGTSHNTDCSDTNEDVVVTSVPSSMTTAQSFIPNDSATVSAAQGGDLAGSVEFKVFESDDCSGTALYSEIVPVSGASDQTVSTSNTTESTTVANVSWLVSYDSTNPAQEDIPATCHEKTALTINNDGTVSSP
jgi:hypothetical protein